MNLAEAKRLCRNPQCVHHADSFVVIEVGSEEVIQSAATRFSADVAVQWLTDHERRCNRATEYRVEELTR